MKNKFIVCLISIMMTVILSACFTGCDLLKKHVHDESEGWRSNSSTHWHYCKVCQSKLDEYEHIYEGDSPICSVCGWNKSEGKVDSVDESESIKQSTDDSTESIESVDSTESGESTYSSESIETSDSSETSGESGYDPSDEEPIEITDKFIADNSASNYGYNWLGTLTKGITLQALYSEIDGIAKSFMSGTASIENTKVNTTDGEVTYKTIGKVESGEVNADDMRNVYRTYCYDHPYHFWQDQVQLVGSSSNFLGTTTYSAYVVIYDEYVNRSVYISMLNKINATIKEIYAESHGSENAYEKTLAYYKALALKGDYAPTELMSHDYAHNIVGLFDEDDSTYPVCEGYSRSLQLMLNLGDVENVYCVGYASSIGTGGGGPHAWNMAKLDDGKWYYFDLTWDDDNNALNGGKGGTCRFDYFAVTSTDTPNKYLFTESHLVGTPTGGNGAYLYSIPTNIASSRYDEIDFTITDTYSNSDFTFIRNGYDTVSVFTIDTNDVVVSIPKTVNIYGLNYTVTEIGPYLEGGAYKTILKTVKSRSLIVPDTIKAIGSASFYFDAKMTIYYTGTLESWNKIVQGKNVFGKVLPEIYTAGEWELIAGNPIPKLI